LQGKGCQTAGLKVEGSREWRRAMQGNIEAAAQFAWEDVVEQVPLPGQGPGLNGLKDIIRAMRAGFPDLVFSIQEQIAEHDKVASRFEWTGTHNGEFLGIPATGRPVRVWGIVIDRLQDGRIFRIA
jgi:predicted ester cyclase